MRKKPESLIYSKVPPQAVELEEAVLGACMLERDTFETVAAIIPHAECFYVDAHQKVYSAMSDIYDSGAPIDLLTISDYLRKRNELDAVGGAYFLTKLTMSVMSSAHVEAHARIVMEKYMYRELIRICGEKITAAYAEDGDVMDLLDNTEKEIASITSTIGGENATHVSDTFQEIAMEVEEARATDEEVTLSGVDTGYKELNEVINGCERGEVVIIGARPSQGKCLGKGTKVIMFDGTKKNVEDIIVGDVLMGDDSTPRNVLSLARGREMMYWVRQNKAIDYRVNESHIISLKKTRREGKGDKNALIDIELRDYLTKSVKWKSSHKGYKVAIEFEEKPLPINPYFIGLWLGDGKTEDSNIYSPEPEVELFLFEMAIKEGYRFVKSPMKSKVCYDYKLARYGDKQSIKSRLRDISILGNKHIPHDYLCNSRYNRLQLLAGIIDSDGHKTTTCVSTYEVTFKLQHLAEQLKYLCDTLGLHTNIAKKVATMKREDGSYYSCDVYRVHIGGDTTIIPCKVRRKQARPWTDIRNWQNTGFKIEQDCVDDYYGFEIDGNRRFLLEDCTVTHNTALSLNLSVNAVTSALSAAGEVYYVSLETTKKLLVRRLAAERTRVPLKFIKRPRLMSEDEYERFSNALSIFMQLPIYIDDKSLTLRQITAAIRKRHKAYLKTPAGKQGLPFMVVIDYLQLIKGEKAGSKQEEVANISRELKLLAKELDIVIIELAQVGRQVDARTDKRPALSDLKESGAIEQDADKAIFIWHETDANTGEVVTHLLVLKNKDGELGDVKLKFAGDIQKWMDNDMLFEHFNPAAGIRRPDGYQDYTEPQKPINWEEF